MGHVVNLAAQGQHPHGLPIPLLEAQVLGLQALAGQVLRHTSHALGNGHAVVVQNDNHGLSAVPRVGQTLIGQSAGEGSVPYQGNHSVALPQHGPCPRHSQGHRHRVGGVAGDKGVVDTLPRLGEAGDAPVLAQSGHGLPPPGEHFMGVALVAHVKDQPVHRRVEYPVNRHCQLHRPQVGGQMPPGLGHAVHQLPAQLRA